MENKYSIKTQKEINYILENISIWKDLFFIQTEFFIDGWALYLKEKTIYARKIVIFKSNSQYSIKSFEIHLNNYKKEVIVPKDQLIKKVIIDNGQKEFTIIKTDREIAYPIRNDELKYIKKVVNIPDSVKAPIKKGQKIGNISVFLNDKLIDNIDLISNETIDAKTNMQKAIEFIKNIFN